MKVFSNFFVNIFIKLVNRKVAKKLRTNFIAKIVTINTSRKSSYDKHKMTAKHLQLKNVNNKLTESCEIRGFFFK
jgi:hypothetical protein